MNGRFLENSINTYRLRLYYNLPLVLYAIQTYMPEPNSVSQWFAFSYRSRLIKYGVYSYGNPFKSNYFFPCLINLPFSLQITLIRLAFYMSYNREDCLLNVIILDS